MNLTRFHELSRLPGGGYEAIPVVRSLQRRLLMLAPARARVERGESVDGVMASLGKSVFWKDKTLVAKLLAKWDARGLATVSERAGRLERELMFSRAPDQQLLGEELLAIARAARRAREARSALPKAADRSCPADRGWCNAA